MDDFKFEITPHIVKQLGEQLVSDEVTALLELIKNSYDADSSYVSIVIQTKGTYQDEELLYKSNGGYIVVQDDGFGMEKKTIIDSWLVISYSNKRAKNSKSKKTKTPQGRTPLGEKGLGRLSTQRLAKNCEILTKMKSKQGLHVAFDWSDFDNATKLSNVKIRSKKYSSKETHGTKLVLTDLKYPQTWKDSKLLSLLGKVSQIISPYKENRPFQVYFTVDGVDYKIDNYNSDVSSLAMSSFKLSVKEKKLIITGKTKLRKFLGNKQEEYNTFLDSDNGKKFFAFLNKEDKNIVKGKDNYFLSFKKTFILEKDIGGLEYIEETNNKSLKTFAHPGQFKAKILEFSFKKWGGWNVTKNSSFDRFADYKDFTQRQIGIKIFRNGFAVKPYGIDGQDWLKLRESQTGGGFYRLRPANVMGYFSIDENENFNLKDKTDREGLSTNPYSNNFFIVSNFFKEEINRYQEKIRRLYDVFLKSSKYENSGISNVQGAFDVLSQTIDESEEIIKEIDQSLEDIDTLSNQTQNLISEVDQELFNVKPEVRKKLSEIITQIDKIEISLNKHKMILSKSKKFQEVIDTIEPKIKVLEEQLFQFSELASMGLSAEAINHEFSNLSQQLNERVLYYNKLLKNKDKVDKSEIFTLLEFLRSISNSLMLQLKHSDSFLKYKRSHISTFYVGKYLSNERKYYSNRLSSAKITMEINIIDDFEVKCNRGKLTQVIDNLISNSEYWLKNKAKTKKTFKGKIKIKIDKPWLIIQDNGYGINKDIEDQIFEPFVTTKPNNEGRGLGLFISQQLLDSMACTIVLSSERNKHSRRYSFEMNLTNIVSYDK